MRATSLAAEFCILWRLYYGGSFSFSSSSFLFLSFFFFVFFCFWFFLVFFVFALNWYNSQMLGKLWRYANPKFSIPHSSFKIQHMILKICFDFFNVLFNDFNFKSVKLNVAEVSQSLLSCICFGLNFYCLLFLLLVNLLVKEG